MIKPALEKNAIPVIMACDNNYVPYLSVALASIQKNSSPEHNYDIYILHQNITDESQERIVNQFAGSANFSVRFWDVTSYIEDYHLQISRYYSVEIYFRALIPALLPSYSKAIYLDCDLVVLCDLAQLWKIKIGDNYLGAVRDIGMMLHYYTSGRRYISLEYFHDTLESICPDDYFNTGVLIMNLDRFRRDLPFRRFADKVAEKKWHFPDQDVLNILCVRNVHYLDMTWNVTPETPGNRKIDNILSDLPKQHADAYVASRKSPKIVHFALHEKPWKYTLLLDRELFECFWAYAALSPFFEEVLSEKKKTASIAELEYIMDRHMGEATKPVADNREIYYVTEKHYLGRQSNVAVKCECAELRADGLSIEGYTVFPCQKDAEEAQFFLSVNGQLYPCERYMRNISEVFSETIRSEAVSFRGFVPFFGQGKLEIGFVCKLRNASIVLNRINYGQYFPIDKRYKGQYYYNNGYKLFLHKNGVTAQKCSRGNLVKAEFNYLKRLAKSKEIRRKKAVFMRILYWIGKIVPHKPIWLIGDNFLGEDNGAAFFDFLSAKQHEIRPIFAASKKSAAYQKMKGRKHVIPFESKIYKVFFLLSSCSVSSITDRRLIKPFETVNDSYRDILHKRNYIFLQHGVITQDLSREHNKYCYNPKGFVVSAYPEYDSLLNGKYFYSKKEVWLTGLPRFDLLSDDKTRKYITIMPTWRAYLVTNAPSGQKMPLPSFKESAYFQFYHSLFHSQKLLQRAAELGYTICYKPHPLMNNCTACFALDEQSTVQVLDERYRDIFCHSSLIVSDYSSAIFDFLYLRKPIIYAHFDKEEFFSGKHCYDKGYLDYERDGFGEVEYDLDGTIDRIIEYMENGCQMKDIYRERADRFFAFSDKNNCQRVYEKIRRLESGE